MLIQMHRCAFCKSESIIELDQEEDMMHVCSRCMNILVKHRHMLERLLHMK